jgi:geranylgeranyl reductase family protein
MSRSPDSVWDVVISGAGPAGSTLAYRLACAGVRTIVVERAQFPRWKPCGGGLQARSLSHLPLEISPVIETTLTNITFTLGFGDHFVKSAGAPLAFGIRRNLFDAYLLDAAVGAGATLLDRTTSSGVRQLGDRVVLETTAGPITGRILVGADGANGVVSRSVNEWQAFDQQVGLYAEVPRDWFRSDSIDGETIRIDWGTLPSGYGWIFPKRETVNVGVGTLHRLGSRLRQYFADFVSAERILRDGRASEIHLIGHTLPTMTSRTQFVKNRVLVVGDAAGMVEPLTGDGLSQAFLGSQLAAQSILAALGAEKPDLRIYAAAVRKHIEPEFRHARALQALFSYFPKLFHSQFQQNARPWQTFAQVLQGKASYADLTSPDSVLWSALGGFCPAILSSSVLRQA